MCRFPPTGRRPVSYTHLAHDLTAQTALLESGQTAQIDSCLGVAVAGQHTAAACNKRKNVSRTAQLLRLGVDIRTFAAGKAAFLCGNAGRGVHMVDGDRERGVVVVGVDLYHLLETETECNLLTHRCADQALGVNGHEVDIFRGGELGGTDQVSLVCLLYTSRCV